MEDSFPLFSMALTDERDEVLLLMVDNSLAVATEHWDVTFEGQTLTARSAPRDIFASLTIDPMQGIHINRGRILRYGVELEIWPDCIGIVNNGLSIHANGGGLARAWGTARCYSAHRRRTSRA